jgi:FSR family fosmidomycin resistance protein-like MFS transporter
MGMAGNAFYHPQVTSIIKNFYKDNIALSRAIGMFLGFGTLGYSFGPYLSSYIVEKFADNFIYLGIIGITAAIITLFFVPKIEKKETKSASNFYLVLKDILKNKACVLLILLTVLKACLVMSFGTYIPFLLKKYGFLTTQTGFIMTTFFVMGGLAMIFASNLEKKIGLRGMIVVSYLPLLPLTLAALFSLKYNLKVLAVILFITIGFFILLAAGCVLANSQKLIPNNTGTISGIIQGFTLALGSLLLIPLGSLGQHFGVSFVLILVTLIAGICSIYCAKTKLLDNAQE